MNAVVIFGLLAILMLTGMPISISLGLTVLTFLFTMTQVPLESVALKLFTGIEKFEIMAIPFFILAGNFLTHGGVAKRMINFATSMEPGDCGCDRLNPSASDGQGGVSQEIRGWCDFNLGGARHPDPAIDRHGDVLGGNQYLGRRPVHGWRGARYCIGAYVGRGDLVSRP